MLLRSNKTRIRVSWVHTYLKTSRGLRQICLDCSKVAVLGTKEHGQLEEYWRVHRLSGCIQNAPTAGAAAAAAAAMQLPECHMYAAVV